MKKIIIASLLLSACAQAGAMNAGAQLMRTMPAQVARNFLAGGLWGMGCMTCVKEGQSLDQNVYPLLGFKDATWNKIAVGSGCLAALGSGGIFGIVGFKLMSDACPHTAGIKKSIQKQNPEGSKKDTGEPILLRAGASARETVKSIWQSIKK